MASISFSPCDLCVESIEIEKQILSSYTDSYDIRAPLFYTYHVDWELLSSIFWQLDVEEEFLGLDKISKFVYLLEDWDFLYFVQSSPVKNNGPEDKEATQIQKLHHELNLCLHNY